VRELKRSECAILPLVLKRRWYDMIKRGEKREEYRDYTTYWQHRIANWCNNQKPDWDSIETCKWLVIGFSLGYRKSDLFFLLHSRDVRDFSENPDWGEPDGRHYVLTLGDRVTFTEDEKEGGGK